MMLYSPFRADARQNLTAHPALHWDPMLQPFGHLYAEGPGAGGGLRERNKQGETPGSHKKELLLDSQNGEGLHPAEQPSNRAKFVPNRGKYSAK